jgi:hypothetical protein
MAKKFGQELWRLMPASRSPQASAPQRIILFWRAGALLALGRQAKQPQKFNDCLAFFEMLRDI